MKDRAFRATLAMAAALTLTTGALHAQNGHATPDWMTVDEASKTITIELVAGMTGDNNSWNFNGYTSGAATIVVPVGYTVKIDFENKDAAVTHSVGVGAMETSWPAMYTAVTPVFDGAVSSNPTDMVNATASGASETLEFVAETPGEYALVCYLPAHAMTGMWIGFNVTADGSAGVMTS